MLPYVLDELGGKTMTVIGEGMDSGLVEESREDGPEGISLRKRRKKCVPEGSSSKFDRQSESDAHRGGQFPLAAG
jgi:hypothetical protein